jgi:hypothetical protein
MMAIIILKNNITFTSREFYQRFLGDVAHYYPNSDPIKFRLIDGNDDTAATDKYRIDAVAIPLLLCLAEQLKGSQNGKPLQLDLLNNYATIPLLEFLYKGDFFNIVGTNKNPFFPIGRNLFQFNDEYLGGFEGKKYRQEHKIRAYSQSDDYLSVTTVKEYLKSLDSDDERRDFLIGKYSYDARDHFSELLQSEYIDKSNKQVKYYNEFTAENSGFFIDILSELISNGIMHSKTDVYAAMFVDRFTTRFSIADNGIGLKESLSQKDESTEYYKKMELSSMLKNVTPISLPDAMRDNLTIIFETLFYSMIKKREGLFDLMSNVVDGNGYFRLHTECAQIIISKRMGQYINKLQELRKQIRESYYIDESMLPALVNQAQNIFKDFYRNTLLKYNEDVKYSSVRFNKVKFNGVHIEVEIPNI